jgi:hypothetical protein
MDRTAFALILVSVLLSGCQTQQAARLAASAGAQAATATFATALPKTLPDSCIAEMPAAFPRRDEPWVSTIDRWLVLRSNRNDQATACAEWWRDYRARVGAR